MGSNEEGEDGHWRHGPPVRGPRESSIPEEEQVTCAGAAGFAAHGYKRLPCANVQAGLPLAL
eukprot:9090131-Lingulodinium_polyedra.AAC.1